MVQGDTTEMKSLRWAPALLTVWLAGTAWADTVVVTADHMVDVIAGKVVDHPQITITDGRITAGATFPQAPAGSTCRA